MNVIEEPENNVIGNKRVIDEGYETDARNMKPKLNVIEEEYPNSNKRGRDDGSDARNMKPKPNDDISESNESTNSPIVEKNDDSEKSTPSINVKPNDDISESNESTNSPIVEDNDNPYIGSLGPDQSGELTKIPRVGDENITDIGPVDPGKSNNSPIVEDDNGNDGSNGTTDTTDTTDITDTTDGTVMTIEKTPLQEYIECYDFFERFYFDKINDMEDYLIYTIIERQLNIFNNLTKKYECYEKDSKDIVNCPTKDAIKEAIEEASGSYKRSYVMGGCGSNNKVIQNNDQDPKFNLLKKIYLSKFSKELKHDFNGSERLNDEEEILSVYQTSMNSIELPLGTSDDLKELYDNLNSTTGEWSFYTNVIEYYLNNCGSLSDVTMVKYRSVKLDDGGETYEFKIIGETDHNKKLFNIDDFNCRFPDNSTENNILVELSEIRQHLANNGILSPHGSNPGDPDYRELSNDGIIDYFNVAKLIDPANITTRDGKIFYKDFRLFSELHDINNCFHALNEKIIGYCCQAVNFFFKILDGEYISTSALPQLNDESTVDDYLTYYKSLPIKFIVNNGTTVLTDDGEIKTYYEHMKLKFEGITQVYKYQGIRIELGYFSDQLNQSFIELHVGDTTIKNVAELVNNKVNFSLYCRNPTDPKNINRLNPKHLRLLKFAHAILISKDRSINISGRVNEMMRNVVALKGWGDSFQVFYCSSMRSLVNDPLLPNGELKEYLKKCYVISTDKNTIAESMLYASKIDSNPGILFCQSGLGLKLSTLSKLDEEIIKQINESSFTETLPNVTRYGSNKGFLTNIPRIVESEQYYREEFEKMLNNFFTKIETPKEISSSPAVEETLSSSLVEETSPAVEETSSSSMQGTLLPVEEISSPVEEISSSTTARPNVNIDILKKIIREHFPEFEDNEDNEDYDNFKQRFKAFVGSFNNLLLLPEQKSKLQKIFYIFKNYNDNYEELIKNIKEYTENLEKQQRIIIQAIQKQNEGKKLTDTQLEKIAEKVKSTENVSEFSERIMKLLGKSFFELISPDPNYPEPIKELGYALNQTFEDFKRSIGDFLEVEKNKVQPVLGSRASSRTSARNVLNVTKINPLDIFRNYLTSSNVTSTIDSFLLLPENGIYSLSPLANLITRPLTGGKPKNRRTKKNIKNEISKNINKKISKNINNKTYKKNKKISKNKNKKIKQNNKKTRKNKQ